MDDSIKSMTRSLLVFRDERDWKQFHNLKDQVLSLVLESSELLELTQWKNGDDLQRQIDEHREAFEDELVDVLGWVLLIAADQKVDLQAAFERKMIKNRRKYPVEKARGSAKKYTSYE